MNVIVGGGVRTLASTKRNDETREVQDKSRANAKQLSLAVMLLVIGIALTFFHAKLAYDIGKALAVAGATGTVKCGYDYAKEQKRIKEAAARIENAANNAASAAANQAERLYERVSALVRREQAVLPVTATQRRAAQLEALRARGIAVR